MALLDAATGAVIDILDMPTYALSRSGKAKRELDPHSLARGDRPLDDFALLNFGFASNRRRRTDGDLAALDRLDKLGNAVTTRDGGILDAAPADIKQRRRIGLRPSVNLRKVRPFALSHVCDLRRHHSALAFVKMTTAAHHWPLVKHDGRAEAALIALHGLRTLSGLARAA